MSVDSTINHYPGSSSFDLGQTPFGIYDNDPIFYDEAPKVALWCARRLGYPIIDVELIDEQFYACLEEATSEYASQVNQFNIRNNLAILQGQDVKEDYSQKLVDGSFVPNIVRMSDAYGTLVGVGGNTDLKSGSIDLVAGQQDYDLQAAADTALSASGHTELMGKRAVVTRVYYVTPRAMWRFFAYYGGINVIGNMTTYGMYTDDSTFEVVPTFQNKLQAMMYEDSIYTRTSHHSYEIVDNMLRLYPVPAVTDVTKMYFKFYIVPDAWQAGRTDDGIGGVNNLNTLPFENIPYTNINSIGKQWIRRYALALSKEMLGQIRGKFGGAIPAPGVTVTLNATALLGEADKEKTALRDELVKVLDELTYAKIAETQAAIVKNASEALKYVPLPIFVG